MRLLLINPRAPDSFWSFKWAVHTVLPGKRAVNPPLGLATVAALCPADWQVEIIDENIEAVPLAPDADIIGIGGMGVQAPRQRELIRYYREKKYYVTVGGAAASLNPEKYDGLADTVVAGESEYIWPEFCRDFINGCPKTLYRETGTVNLSDSPVPRFDLLKLSLYSNATLQYSRGCPFTCEFCDIIVMFGREPRMKSSTQVGHELDALRQLGVHSIFFVDDNFIGNKKKAKDLLSFLVEYQNVHHYKFSFGTEVSLNLAQDDELLRLFKAANFGWVFIGIESTDPVSLTETGKKQNLREDILTSVRRIYSQGIDILAGFIIGFDNDTSQTFETQYRFITDAGIQSAMIGQLTAMPHTPLYDRMVREGRLREVHDDADNTQLFTNIIPKNMSDDDMSHHYRGIYRSLLSDAGIGNRIRNKIRYFGIPSYSGGYTKLQSIGIIFRLIRHGIIPGGFSRIFYFMRSFPILNPALIPLVISDWITGLSMRNFARDHLWAAPIDYVTDTNLLNSVQEIIARRLQYGKVWVNHKTSKAIPNLTIQLDAALNRRFFKNATPILHHLMKQSHVHLTLSAQAMPVRQLKQFERLLMKLENYGDRIFVIIDETLCRQIDIDLSIFNLMLIPSPELIPTYIPIQKYGWKSYI